MRRVAALALLLAACGPDKGPDSASTPDAATTGDASSASCPVSYEDPTGSPMPDTCAAQLTQKDCAALLDGDGFNACRWQPEFALWSEQCGCGTFAGPARCLPVFYAGDGCVLTMCPSEANIYYRELPNGVVELMDYGGCDMQPNDWSRCRNTDTDPPACECFC